MRLIKKDRVGYHFGEMIENSLLSNLISQLLIRYTNIGSFLPRHRTLSLKKHHRQKIIKCLVSYKSQKIFFEIFSFRKLKKESEIMV